jgi:hypothetical protein
MDQTMSYAEILTRVVREEGKLQPKHGPAIVSVCDQETGQFMLVAVGWQNRRHIDSILFHAQLKDGVVTIETDMTEEGLKSALIEAGIHEDDIQSISFRAQRESEQVAA